MRESSNLPSLVRTILSQISQDFSLRFRKNILRQDPFLPWMKPREIEVFQDLFQRFQPRRILEWGAGYGTLFFSRICPPFEVWLSIEHHQPWFEKIGALNTDSRVEIVNVKPNDPILTDRFQDGNYRNFKDYIEFPANLDPFDLIIVDGRARMECLKRCRDFLNGRGVVILHDANRRHYRTFPGGFADNCLFQDYRTLEGGLWIASQDRTMEDLIDLGRHRQVWRVYQKFWKWFGWKWLRLNF